MGLHARKRVLGIFILQVAGLCPINAGEMNLSGIFAGFQGDDKSEQQKLENRLEEDLAKFRSVESASVMIPVSEASHQENLWGVSEPGILSVEAVVKLKKRRRLLQDELKGITNLITSALADRNRVVQVMVRDQDGYEWTDDKPETAGFFKIAKLENEVSDRLQGQYGSEIDWKKINVNAAGNCLVSGTYLKPADVIPMQVRSEVMSVLQGVCKTAKIKIVPQVALAGGYDPTLLWLERAAFVLIGFGVFGVAWHFRRKARQVKVEKDEVMDGDAIILTKIVERSPDEAAKWMVRALLSDSDDKEKVSDNPVNGAPQIFDQSS